MKWVDKRNTQRFYRSQNNILKFSDMKFKLEE